MKVLVIRQPWAWSIIHAGKDIENRTWGTKFTGRFLIAASASMTKSEYCAWWDFVMMRRLFNVPPVERKDLLLGGIIGSVVMTGIVAHSDSKWFEGPRGFVLKDPKPLPFRPIKGRLGFFEEPK